MTEATDKQLTVLADDLEAGRAWLGGTRDQPAGITVKVIAALRREPNGVDCDYTGGSCLRVWCKSNKACQAFARMPECEPAASKEPEHD